MSTMNVEYIGRKDGVEMARPEMEKHYTFSKGKAVAVTRKDGLYLTEEFPRSFVESVEPAEVEDRDPVAAFIEKMFPGKTAKDLGKDELEARCLEVTDGKVNLKKNKTVENMIKDFMDAVEGD